jgi:serine/threonine protein kinase
MGLLGQGGFGRVVHVRKTSTQKHYAMKIQLKAELLREYKGDESHLDTEKNVFSACHHPFVVDLAYAIQTEVHNVGRVQPSAMIHAELISIFSMLLLWLIATYMLQQHAILILGLVRAGDLEDAMVKDLNRKLSPDRVYFYIAEITLALQHMHDLGMLYRDLKPCNVLLGTFGIMSALVPSPILSRCLPRVKYRRNRTRSTDGHGFSC